MHMHICVFLCICASVSVSVCAEWYWHIHTIERKWRHSSAAAEGHQLDSTNLQSKNKAASKDFILDFQILLSLHSHYGIRCDHHTSFPQVPKTIILRRRAHVIEAWNKWLPFCWPHIQMHFYKMHFFIYLAEILLNKQVSICSGNGSVRNKTVPEQMPTC